MQFKNGYSAYERCLSLGEDLMVVDNFYSKNVKPSCRFVKVTEKGFNILNLLTNRMVLKKHLYAIGMAGKGFPNSGPIRARFRIPSYLTLITKNSIEEAS